MSTIPISVTDFARGLSDYLNQVQYLGQTLDIARGKKIVARIAPVAHQDGYPIEALGQFLANGPQLTPLERREFAKDVQAIRSSVKAKPDPWA
jgi:antitoxin (DNA-binding transcriptional repressor) of toxin-antitoxin stability system